MVKTLEDERAARASEERLRHLMQQMPGFVAVLTGPDHIYEYVNDAYVAISGPRNFLGRRVREVFPDLAGQGFYELLDQVYATGQPYSVQGTPIRLAGESETRYIDLLFREEAYRNALVHLADRISDLDDPDDIGTPPHRRSRVRP